MAKLSHAQKLGREPQGPSREPPRQVEPELEEMPEPTAQEPEPPLEPVVLRPGAVRTTVAYALSYIPAQGLEPGGYAMESFQIDFDAQGRPTVAVHECSNPTDRGNAGNLFRMNCGDRIRTSSRDLQVDRVMRDEAQGRRDPGDPRSDGECALDYFARRAERGDARGEYVFEAKTPQAERQEVVRALKADGWSAWTERELLIGVVPRERRRR